MQLFTTVLMAFLGISGLLIDLPGSALVWAEPSAGVGAGATLSNNPGGDTMDNCPMHVPGTTVTSANVEGGASMVFTTKAGGVPELRRRVAHMAGQHNERNLAGGRMIGGKGMNARGFGSSPRMIGNGMMIPAATATAEDIEDGARLVLHSTAPLDLEKLRAHVRRRVSRMDKGECPMISASDIAPKGRGGSMPSPFTETTSQ